MAGESTSTSPTPFDRVGEDTIRERYGNLFEMYQRITDENPYQVPMRIYPAVHYTMGGLWVDYDLMSNLPGLFVIGEANFSDHGANRLGASALMQGLADGVFHPPVHGRRLSRLVKRPATRRRRIPPCGAPRRRRRDAPRLLAIRGKRTVDSFHRELGKHHVGQLRNGTQRLGSHHRLRAIPALREEFWRERRMCPAAATSSNQSLEKAGRVADFLEFAELMCRDALHREESCGGHFRAEHQTADGEARRDDEQFLLRRPRGSIRAPRAAAAAQGAAGVRECPSVDEEL